jgi:putative oxidoreductase
MIDHKTAPYGAAILRITAGLAFLAHAALKLFVFTPSGTMHYFASLGLPGWFGLFVIAAEGFDTLSDGERERSG